MPAGQSYSAKKPDRAARTQRNPCAGWRRRAQALRGLLQHRARPREDCWHVFCNPTRDAWRA